jgi:sugar phosphate isomerase/epimerase
MLNITLSTGAFYKYGFKEIIGIMSETDCSDIELCLNNTVFDVPFREIVREIERKNLTARSIHAPFHFLYRQGEDERFWILKCIELAKALGAGIVTTHTTFTETNGVLTSLDEQHKRNLIEFRESDIIVCAENMPKLPVDTFLSHHVELLDFINEYGIAMTFDTTHWDDGEMGLLDRYALFKKHIRNIHISDKLNGVEHKILGTGDLPIGEFVRTLQKDGYGYPLTVELDLEDRGRNDVETKEQAIEALNVSLGILRSAQNDSYNN